MPTKEFRPPEWEICIGAILAQNTNWSNVERALDGLKAAGMTGIMDVMSAKTADLENAVRPSGFYRQKAGRLKLFADFVMGFGGFRRFSHKVTREQLLKVRGLGPETADSILLYALGRPVFVIDAYTRRVFTRLGFDIERCSRRKSGEGSVYEEWRRFFESILPKDAGLYKEFHALIVELAKRHCRARPVCKGCPLGKECRKVF